MLSLKISSLFQFTLFIALLLEAAYQKHSIEQNSQRNDERKNIFKRSQIMEVPQYESQNKQRLAKPRELNYFD